MTDPGWPTKLARQRVLENTQESREDGYVFTTVMGMLMENGEEVVWRTEGRVRTTPWGQVHHLENSISGIPPHMKMSDVPQSITRELRPIEGGKKHRVRISETIEFADQRFESSEYTVETDTSLDELVFADPERVTSELRDVHEQGAEPSGPAQPGKLLLNPKEG